MKKNRSIVDPGKMAQKTFSIAAEVQKNADAGLFWIPLGAANNAVRVGAKTPVMCFNSTASIAYVTFGDATVAAPAAPATAIPILPNSLIILNSGDNEWVRASAATVFVYSGDAEISQ